MSASAWMNICLKQRDAALNSKLTYRKIKQGFTFLANFFSFILRLSLSLSLYLSSHSLLCPLHPLTHCSLYGVNLMADSASKASTPPLLFSFFLVCLFFCFGVFFPLNWLNSSLSVKKICFSFISLFLLFGLHYFYKPLFIGLH